MSEYSKDTDPTLAGGNGGYGREEISRTEPTDAQYAAMWKNSYEIERKENRRLKSELELHEKSLAVLVEEKVDELRHDADNFDTECGRPSGTGYRSKRASTGETTRMVSLWTISSSF